MKLVINDNLVKAFRISDCTEVIRNTQVIGPPREFVVHTDESMDAIEAALADVTTISNIKVLDDSDVLLFESVKYTTFRDITRNIAQIEQSIHVSFIPAAV